MYALSDLTSPSTQKHYKSPDPGTQSLKLFLSCTPLPKDYITPLSILVNQIWHALQLKSVPDDMMFSMWDKSQRKPLQTAQKTFVSPPSQAANRSSRNSLIVRNIANPPAYSGCHKRGKRSMLLPRSMDGGKSSRITIYSCFSTLLNLPCTPINLSRRRHPIRATL